MALRTPLLLEQLKRPDCRGGALLRQLCVLGSISFAGFASPPALACGGRCSSALAGAIDDASSDTDEDGFPKQRLGSGVWGRGSPLTSVLMGKKRPFVDGAGLGCALLGVGALQAAAMSCAMAVVAWPGNASWNYCSVSAAIWTLTGSSSSWRVASMLILPPAKIS